MAPVDTEVLAEVDGLLQIPCFGVKNSLNVATAGSVFIWEALRQWSPELELTAEGLSLIQI